ncbi:DUF5343 domain-containing protein [Halalkalibaculum sp. DA3122]|uniref:DUF5343 domain-containing protein n=1 Tax=unclassified Halalkalibaculum TaxID=2964617 RepID=UPI0037540569
MNIFETFVTKSTQLDEALEKIRKQDIPEYFNQDFLEQIDLKRPNSIHYVMLFKKLGLVDENDEPFLEFYSQFVESEDRSRALIAELVKKAYARLYEQDKEIHKLPKTKIHNLFRQVMGDEKSNTFVQLVADTFIALTKYADWNSSITVDLDRHESVEHSGDMDDSPEEEDTSNSVDTAVEHHISDIDEDQQEEETVLEEELAVVEANGIIPGETEDNGVSEWFKKPANAHEEFLLELLNGNSDHHYRTDTEASTRNGHSSYSVNGKDRTHNGAAGTKPNSKGTKPNTYYTKEEPGGNAGVSENGIEFDWGDLSLEEPFNTNGDEVPAQNAEERVDDGNTTIDQSSKNSTDQPASADHLENETMEDIQLLSSQKNGTGNIEEESDLLKNALIKRANLLTELGRFEEAVNAFDEILKYAKTDISVGKEEITASIYQKAQLLEKLNRLDEAVHTYDELIQQYFVRVPASVSKR